MRGHKVKTLVQDDVAGCHIYLLHRFSSRSVVGGTNRTQSLRVELNSVWLVASAQVLANFGVDNTSHFPGAVEMFETCALRNVPWRDYER